MRKTAARSGSYRAAGCFSRVGGPAGTAQRNPRPGLLSAAARFSQRKGAFVLDKIIHILFRSWYTLYSLEDRIYHIVLDVAVFISVATVTVGLILRSPASSVISSAVVLLYIIILQYITMRHPQYSDTCRLLLVVGLNVLLFPASFFASGGINSGFILFYLLGLAMCAILLRGNLGGIVFVISIVLMELSVTMSTLFPQYVQTMSATQHRQSMKVILLLSGLALYSIVLLILRAYYKERRHNEELMQKLRELSIRDSLSGLFNRRELFRRLELMYGDMPKERTETLTRDGHYIAMFDVDNFKKLNDTYGHSFGDKVLIDVSRVLHDVARPKHGEITSRYGGEEFVTVLTAENLDAAFERVDEARRKIAALRWDENPEVRVSISGGLLSCEENPDLTQAMHDVDALLYRAKAAGKDQICVSGA